MSYSRWSCSNWYAFHNTYSGEDKDSQLLSLWHVSENKDFLYSELKNVDKDFIKANYAETLDDDDIEEALDIINTFIMDVNEEFDGDKK